LVRTDARVTVYLLPRRWLDGSGPRRAAAPGLDIQLCGAHLSNFGVFAALDQSLVFDVNDFDETLLGPLEWDVKRLAASFAVGGPDRGFDATLPRIRGTSPAESSTASPSTSR